ncbi:pentatricopeptide repeat-containing protein At4g33990 [Asparagus officinalis]|nr:pentatricopeptide repeat-containing protein At4g33990 [Asparagus officinalis]
MDFFNNLFRSCNSLCCTKSLHSLLIVSNQIRDIFFSTKLINLYSRFNDLPSSILTFSQTPNKNTVAFNCLISSFATHNLQPEALHCFRQLMACPELRPDRFTFPAALKSCSSSGHLSSMHSLLPKMAFDKDLYICASLIHMYSRFGLMGYAQKKFDEMPMRDSGCWNAILSGYCQNGEANEVVRVFDEMVREGVEIDTVTVASILPVCAPLDDALMGVLVHGFATKCGLDTDLFVLNALIDMYGKLGLLEDARNVFDAMGRKDLVTWNSMISAYEQGAYPKIALSLFDRMQRCGFQPDMLTLVSLASAVAQLGDGINSRSVHCYVFRRGWDSSNVFVGNAIIDMYGKVGDVEYARRVFDWMPVKDVISWNSLITGCSQNGFSNEATEIYEAMEKSEGVTPSQGTFVSVLPACSHVGALRKGMKIHGRSIQIGLELDVFVGTCLIDMYAKCGRLDEAMLLFAKVPRRTSYPWNAIISGLGVHGHGDKALELFEEMQQEGVKPDNVTFISLLSACSHSGLVDHARHYFGLMKSGYGIEPSVKHYACMVDLLGRAGHLNDAYEFIKNMPLRPDAGVWGALLGACRIHGNVELGDIASNRLFEVDPENVGYYVLLSNMHAKSRNWEGVGEVRSLAKNRQLMKTPGWSSIEVDNKMNVFFMGNQSHPRFEDIYKEMVNLLAKMKSIGYVPDYNYVLQDVEDDEKEHILTMHSERLAIAFGIISTLPKTTIHIFKNLRVCGDCHTATKFISRITEREIIVRDYNRFHHFKGGSCSCGDYW